MAHTVAQEVDGRRRTYVHVAPPAPNPDAPLLLALHGTTQNPRAMRRFSGGTFDRLAASLGADLVYLTGHRRAWNDGRRIRTSAAQRENVDDVGFVEAVLERFARPAIAIGYSNGGQLLHRYLRQSDVPLAGAMLIAAGLPVAEDREYGDDLRQSIPTLLVQGTADPVMPYEGGTVRLLGRSKGDVLSARETAAAYAGTTDAPFESVEGPVRRTDWPGVRLVTLEGAGHVIPNRLTSPPFVGPSLRVLDAGEELRSFFSTASTIAPLSPLPPGAVGGAA
jgi:polyhydroxybutyrate depolymerase